MQFDLMRFRMHGNPNADLRFRISCDGNFIADFHSSPTAFIAFQAFADGLLKKGHTLYDNDHKQFLVGNMKQLLSEG